MIKWMLLSLVIGYLSGITHAVIMTRKAIDKMGKNEKDNL